MSKKTYDRISVDNEGSITVAKLLNPEILDENTINELSSELFQLVDDSSPDHLVINFSLVQHLSSSALGTLIRLNKHVEEKKGHLILCSIKPALYEIFVITKLIKLFDIYESEETALKSLGQ